MPRSFKPALDALRGWANDLPRPSYRWFTRRFGEWRKRVEASTGRQIPAVLEELFCNRELGEGLGRQGISLQLCHPTRHLAEGHIFLGRGDDDGEAYTVRLDEGDDPPLYVWSCKESNSPTRRSVAPLTRFIHLMFSDPAAIEFIPL